MKAEKSYDNTCYFRQVLFLCKNSEKRWLKPLYIIKTEALSEEENDLLDSVDMFLGN
ncbi:MAG: hypothetical protein IKL57_08045 [Oscillospiraceae bacterium]|nr:hypothetical protein [Oscillospiraceae bacterium]